MGKLNRESMENFTFFELLALKKDLQEMAKAGEEKKTVLVPLISKVNRAIIRKQTVR